MGRPLCNYFLKNLRVAYVISTCLQTVVKESLKHNFFLLKKNKGHRHLWKISFHIFFVNLRNIFDVKRKKPVKSESDLHTTGSVLPFYILYYIKILGIPSVFLLWCKRYSPLSDGRTDSSIGCRRHPFAHGTLKKDEKHQRWINCRKKCWLFHVPTYLRLRAFNIRFVFIYFFLHKRENNKQFTK